MKPIYKNGHRILISVRSGEPQSRELARQQKCWQDYLIWTVLLYAALKGKTVYICKRFLLSFLLFQVHMHFFSLFCSCRPLHSKWPKKHKYICTCITAFNVCSIIASINLSRFRKRRLPRYKLYNCSLTFYTLEQHWQIKAASLPSTNIWASSLVVHSTAHWWLWSSHFLCADPACHSLKCCLWSS